MNFKEQRERKAFLALEDGSVFYGYSAGAPADACGEAVFNTSMGGYQEILSDPSCAGLFVVMTAPEVGCYGVNPDDMESRKFFAAGLITRSINEPSNWRSKESLKEALTRHKTPALAGIDTRALTLHLRERGSQKAFICATGEISPEKAIEKAKAWQGIDNRDYASVVSCEKPYEWEFEGFDGEKLPPADLHIVAYDFGIKYSILKNLRRTGMKVTVVPANTPAKAVLAMKPGGVFLSSGPGDPAATTYAVENTKNLIGKVPIMGVCLGHQIIGLALGGKTQKLKLGHHGCNIPIKDCSTKAVEISSQNHNYTVIPQGIEKSTITYENLNDGSIEGLHLKNEKVFSVEFQPEMHLFKKFREMVLEK
ncbi:MAG: glutamine-hydrolyzing carbamoyl-phosphate synthase small subunit [Fibromonadaceae bacterium]|jgi:carbamoyl-phosphate synthase small subunit|nr:glutamine-hydrolyzing carbamoyl-phosphate synthase small subunit [Fibromonadaceae bacterium]